MGKIIQNMWVPITNFRVYKYYSGKKSVINFTSGKIHRHVLGIAYREQKLLYVFSGHLTITRPYIYVVFGNVTVTWKSTSCESELPIIPESAAIRWWKIFFLNSYSKWIINNNFSFFNMIPSLCLDSIGYPIHIVLFRF